MDKKISQEIIEKLYSADEKIVLKTIKSLSTKSKIGFMPLLFDLFFQTTNPTVKTAINQVFDNTKEEKIVPFFVDAIQKYWDKEELKQLVCSCWQNGLDFSNHLSTFLDLVLEKKLEIALEAFTVIEENKDKLPEEDIKMFIARLKQGKFKADKRFLIVELVNVLENKNVD